MKLFLILLGLTGFWQFESVAMAGTDCASGTVLDTVLEGNLGTAPNGGFESLLCFEINNDTTVTRQEIAYASVPISQSQNLLDAELIKLVVIGAGDQLVASSFTTISRWGEPLSNSSAPIRWLQVALPAKVMANSINNYELRLYDVEPTVADPFALSISQAAGEITVSSLLAAFKIGLNNPRFFNEIKVDHDGVFNNDLRTVYTDSADAGPMLVYSDATNQIQIGGGMNDHQDFDRIFSTAFEPVVHLSQGSVMVDEVGVIESGSVKTVIQMNGHFIANDGSSLCLTPGVIPYERFGFSLVVTFFRGKRTFDIDFEFRNECSDATTGPWTDQIAKVNHVSWSLPLSYVPDDHMIAVDDLLFQSSQTAAFSRVEQHKGDGTGADWQRSASVKINSRLVNQQPYYQNSIVAVKDAEFMASIQMPYMKFREPQALQAKDGQLTVLFVSEAIVLGEGKGIWNQARIDFSPLSLMNNNASVELAALKRTGQLAMERGLLVRAHLSDFNQAKILPSLGNQNTSLLKSNYLSWMNNLHDETVSEDPDSPGQWLRNKTFGSQYWPDTGGNDPFSIDAIRPNDSFSAMNYWDPAGLEILEFLRSGEPKWAWEIAIPVYKNMVHNAYLNIGFNQHGNRGGVAVQAGGPGCEFTESPPGSGNFIPGTCTADGSAGGQWHRSAFGSDDYTYGMSLEMAYITRPNTLMRDRFKMAGYMLVNRYDVLLGENLREDFVNVLNNTRQVIQHFEMLANCAEFVPGQTGASCHQSLKAVMAELSRDNNSANLICQGYPGLINGMQNSDIPNGAVSPSCLTPQQFMVNALIYQFYHRYYLNYGDTQPNSIKTMLMKLPYTHMEYGIARLANNEIDPFGAWWTRLFCQLDTGTQIDSCTSALDSDGNLQMYAYSKPATAALLFIGLSLDENNDWFASNTCSQLKNLFDTVGFTNAYGDAGLWDTVSHFNQAGWWKGSSLMMQSVIYAVGNYDTCL